MDPATVGMGQLLGGIQFLRKRPIIGGALQNTNLLRPLPLPNIFHMVFSPHMDIFIKKAFTSGYIYGAKLIFCLFSKSLCVFQRRVSMTKISMNE